MIDELRKWIAMWLVEAATYVHVGTVYDMACKLVTLVERNEREAHRAAADAARDADELADRRALARAANVTAEESRGR